jgi:predicted KAP-like P-loop ATPase
MRYDILKKAVSEGNAISILVELVEMLEMQHNNEDTPQQAVKEEPLLSKDQILSLKKIAIEKTWRCAENKSLLGTPQFRYVLILWFDWDDKTKIKEWVRDITIQDQGLISFIERFTYKGRLDFKNLELFIDLKQNTSRIQNLKNIEGITEIQKVAIQQAIQGSKNVSAENDQ